MRVAVIGTGSIGRRHIGNLLDLGCDVYGYDPSLEARTRAQVEYPTARIFGLLGGDERYDAWVIATPYDQHLYFAEMAVAARMPMFIEKPLGSLEQIHRWRQLAAMPLPVNQVGYQCRFHPVVQSWPRPAKVGYFDCAVDMRTWPGRYGPSLLECSHDIDLALWFGAPTDRVGGWADDEGAELTFGEFSDRWCVQLFYHADVYRRHWYVATDTEKARARWDFTMTLGDQMYVDEMKHFLDCVRTGTPTRCPLADGLRVLEVCQQITVMAKVTA